LKLLVMYQHSAVNNFGDLPITRTGSYKAGDLSGPRAVGGRERSPVWGKGADGRQFGHGQMAPARIETSIC